MNDRIVIVGGGQAGAQAVASLRSRGFTGAIALIANEAHLPYQRPPLSKKYLAGEILFDRMLIKAEPFYARHDVRLFLDTSAVSVDRERQVVTLSNGEDIEYSGLVLVSCNVSSQHKVRVIFCVRQGAATSHGWCHGKAAQRHMAQKSAGIMPRICVTGH